MNRLRSQRKVAWTLAVLAAVVAINNGLTFLSHPGDPQFLENLVYGVGVVLALGAVAFFLGRMDSTVTRVLLILFFLLPAGPATGTGSASFAGMWMFIIAVVLIVKIDPLPRFRLWLILGAATYYFPWLFLLVLGETGGNLSLGRVLNYAAFLAAAVATLFFLFEDEIRGLLDANDQKDARIARLEPLSSLGERVVHVAESFKNNLALLETAQFHLRDGQNPEQAFRTWEEFRRSMNERIDSILLVSRVGATQEPEVFDAARVLAGLHQIYLSNPTFLKGTHVELAADQPTPLRAVRWDYLLLIECIVKNALDGLAARRGPGTLEIALRDKVLRISHNGGTLPHCLDCQKNCLGCPLYSPHPDAPTGPEHGLEPVFATCRKYGWSLRIRAHGEWATLEIGLVQS